MSEQRWDESTRRNLPKQKRRTKPEDQGIWKGFFQGASQPIFVVDTDYRVLSANSTLLKALNRTADEIIGTKCHELLHGSDHPTRGCPVERLLSGGSNDTVEVEIETLHGTFLVSCIPIFDETVAVTRLVHTAVDITELKRTQRELQESEVKFIDLAEKSIVGIYLVQDGMFKYVNSTIARTLGYTVDEVMRGVTPKDVIFPEDWPMVRENLRKRLSGEMDSLHYEFRIQTRNREIRTIEAYSARTTYKARPAVIGTLLDITERKQTEEELRAAHQRLFDIIEFLPDATFVIDHEKKVVAWNRAIEEMTGIKKEEMIGKGDYSYAIPFYGERRPILIDYVATDPDDLRMNYKAIARKGNVLYAEAFVPGTYNWKGAFLSGNASPLFDKNGNTVGAIESIRDMTELSHLETQLRQSQKLEAIGTLAGGVAHDFNNILTAIIGYGTILKMEMDDEDPRRQYLDQILISSGKAANLTKSLLAFSRKQAIELRPNTINAILGGIEELLSRLLTEDIEFSIVPSDSDMVIMADVTQLDQVLINLATNARDAMPRGGKLVVEAKEVILDSDFAELHGYGRQGAHAMITVTDTGCGMDRETKEKIFEPFFTTKEAGRGTGLGLSIVYGIVKQHNGYITARSEPGKGTVFEVYFPTVEMETADEEQPFQDIPGGKETILVAEDNPDLRVLMGTILKPKGYTVIEATDGEDAVQRFIKNRDSIDLIILDVVMPNKNGKEAHDEIRMVNPNIKTIFMSGYTGDVVIDKGVLDSTVEFVSKPLSPSELLLKVREVLDKPA
jgi:two-component system, cell cycle sensor histidine kinase and response regulator CckA